MTVRKDPPKFKGYSPWQRRAFAIALLFPAPIIGLLYLWALRAHMATAQPLAVVWLAIPPAASLILALEVRATRVVTAAVVELGLCIPLYQLVTSSSVWRGD